MIVCLRPPKGLCEGFARVMEDEVLIAERKRFPDGEVYVRIPGRVFNEDVIVLHTGYPDQNSSLIELYLTVDLLYDLGAERVHVVMTYTPYSRQDRRFREGEAISIKTILKLINADTYFTVDIHKKYSLTYFEGEAYDFPSLPVISRKANVRPDMVLAPDRGALERAKIVAKEFGVPSDYLEKHRDRITGEVTIKPKNLKVEGKRVLIVDDIISTGSTLALAAKTLYQQGAKEVEVAVAHALMIGDAREKLRGAGIKRVITANTLAREYEEEVIDISEELARFVEERIA